jgi:hypothetical protein
MMIIQPSTSVGATVVGVAAPQVVMVDRPPGLLQGAAGVLTGVHPGTQAYRPRVAWPYGARPSGVC